MNSGTEETGAAFSMPRARIISHPMMIQAGDITLVSSLVSSPVWAPWLADVNALLTTCTLLMGAVLGLLRLWGMYREAKRKRHDIGTPAE